MLSDKPFFSLAQLVESSPMSREAWVQLKWVATEMGAFWSPSTTVANNNNNNIEQSNNIIVQIS